MNFNLFDLVFLVILAGFGLIGTMRGLMKEALSLLGLAAGFWAGLQFHAEAGSALAPIVRDENLAELLAFVLMLAAGYLLGTFLGGMRDNTARSRGMGDYAGSLVLGLLKGLVICLSLYWVVDNYVPQFQGSMGDAMSATRLEQIMGWVEKLSL